MNFTREQVAALRRLLEVSCDRMRHDDLADVEHLADVLDAQLDYAETPPDPAPTDAELNEMAERFEHAVLGVPF